MQTLVHDGGSRLWVVPGRDGRRELFKEASRSERIPYLLNEEKISRRIGVVPGVRRVLGVSRRTGSPVLRLEFIEGESLDVWGRRGAGEVTLAERLRVARAIVDVLARVHAAGVVHRDLSARNIIVGPDGGVTLIDFGLAAIGPTPSTRDGFGTPAYMAPEQTGRLDRSIDTRSDLYSLGVVFYELFSGRRPYVRADALELIHAILTFDPPPVRAINPSVPEALARVIQVMMAKEPADRYQSAVGLGVDLQTCAAQLESGDPPSAFPLRTADRPIELRIPERLYGRAEEERQLVEAFESARRGAPTLWLIAGKAGVGKTVLAETLSRTAAAANGSFLHGKFDQYERHVPYSAIAQAFDGFASQILSADELEFTRWRERIVRAVGELTRVVVEVVPGLEPVLGKGPRPPPLNGEDPSERLGRVFRRMLSAIVVPDSRPAVLFIDDLQWIDAASLGLLRALFTEGERPSLLFVGTYREDQLGASHPLRRVLEDLRVSGAQVELSALGNLTRESVRAMLEDTLERRDDVVALADALHAKTSGNPLFLRRLIESLHRRGHIKFDSEARRWTWDLGAIERAAISSNVVDLLIATLRSLPRPTRRALELAACVGSRFEVPTLAALCETDDVEATLASAVAERLIVREGEHYEFAHNRVQEAAYALMDAEQRAPAHLQIGELLLEQTAASHLESQVFELARHLNLGRALIEDPARRLRLAQLNLKAAKRAKTALAHADAVHYTRIGIELLDQDSWQRDDRRALALALHLELHEALYLTAEFQAADEVFATLVAYGRSPTALGRTYHIKISQETMRGDYASAMRLGFGYLKSLGVDITLDGIDEALEELLAGVQKLLRRRQLFEFPTSGESSEELLIASRIIGVLLPSTFYYDPRMTNLLALTTVEIALRRGVLPEMAYPLACSSLAFISMAKDYTTGYELARFALASARRRWRSEPVTIGLTLHSHALFNMHWKEHLSTCASAGREAFMHLNVGHDPQMAGNTFFELLASTHGCGEPLETLEQRTDEALDYAGRTRNEHARGCYLVYRQLVLCMRGETRGVGSFETDEFSEARHLAEFAANPMAIAYYYIHRAECSYLLDSAQKAHDFAATAAGLLPYITGYYAVALQNFYDSLACCRLAGESPEGVREELLRRVDRNQEQMAVWAKGAPMNFRHKYALVAAEQARVRGELGPAIVAYEEAIAASHEHGYMGDEALCNELFGRFWRQRGNVRVADVYIQSARGYYRHRGATAKVAQLDVEFPGSRSWVEGTPESRSSDAGRTGTLSSTSLDLATIFKASATIAREIVLERLVERLLSISIENSGAQRGVLIVDRGGELEVVAVSSTEAPAGGEARAEVGALASSRACSAAVVRFVWRTCKPVVLANSHKAFLFENDPYLSQRSARSVLCVPMMLQGRPTAALYLENEKVFGVFTPDRIRVLETLSTQAAISIENARLYSEMEALVEQRTSQLRDALAEVRRQHEELKSAQSQLVESERLASLGTLVAGVAHEINNPANFVLTGAQNIGIQLDRIRGALEGEGGPGVGPDLTRRFSRAERSRKAVEEGARRIFAIINNLRTFYRDEGKDFMDAKPTNGLRSTLGLVEPSFREQIAFALSIDSEPTVECRPTELNQVFMNLLVNACQAVVSRLAREGDGTCRGSVRVRAGMDDDDMFVVSVEDDGIGMSADISSQVFDPFFTTKPVGQGTGLGLAISRNIVVQHGGEILVMSKVGEGTTFRVRLPLKVPREQPEGATSES